MKATIYLIVIVLFGAHVLSPSLPKTHLPKKVLQQRESISYKEIRLDHLIGKIENQITKDSIQLKNLKNGN
jgi:hypothetical protein